MTIIECTHAIKCGDPSLLEREGYLRPAGVVGYICPNCGSGTGAKGTGTRDFLTDKGYTVQKCFNCGTSFNNLEIIARYHNLNLDFDKDFIEALQIGCEIFGLTLNLHERADEPRRSRRVSAEATPSYAKSVPPEKSVADCVKEAITNLSPDRLVEVGIFTNRAPRHATPRFFFRDEVPFEYCGEEWVALADNEEYKFTNGHVYTNIQILCRFYKLDPSDEFKMYQLVAGFMRLPFKTRAEEKAETEAKVSALVRDDISKAVANIDNIPDDARRGLPLDVLKALHFGWLDNWIHPVNRIKGNGYQSRRLLAVTPNHYEAITPQTDRAKSNPSYWKMHTSPREPFFVDVIPFGEVNLVFEGAVDAASAWYALDKEIPCYATGGVALSKMFVDKLNEMNLTVKPAFVIIYDSDKAGREAAPKFKHLLEQSGYRADIAFLSDDAAKTDANDILMNCGKDALADKLKRLLSGFRVFTLPLPVAVPYGFKLSERGIQMLDSKGFYRTISATPVVISRNFEDSNYENGVVEVSIYDHERNFWHKHLFMKKIIASNSAILELADMGLSVSQSKAKYVSEFLMSMLYLTENIKVIPKSKVYPSPGWTDPKCDRFILPTHNDEYLIGNGDFDYKRAYTPQGDFDTWRDVFIDAALQSYVVRLVTGFALAAPLVYPCGSRNLQLHLCGRSGSGKTAVAKLAASIFGNPADIIKTFNGTLNSLESFPIKFNDGFHCINELQAKKRSARDEELETFLYSFEEGKTRSRLDRNSNQRKTNNFRGNRLTTGEQKLTTDFSGAGALARVVEITDSDILPNDDAIRIHNLADKGNFGHCLNTWIEYIRANKSSICKDYTELRDKLSSSFPDSHNNHIATVALSYTALSHFAKILANAELANVVGDLIDVAGPEWTASDRALLTKDDFSRIFKQLPAKVSTENAERARACLAEYIFTHEGGFVKEYSVEDGGVEYSLPKDHFVTVGYLFADGSVGFFPRELKKILESEYKFPSANAIIRDFAANDWLDFGYQSCPLLQKHIRAGVDRKLKWVYMFKPGVITENNS